MNWREVKINWDAVELLGIEFIYEKLPGRDVGDCLLLIVDGLEFTVNIKPFIDGGGVLVYRNLCSHLQYLNIIKPIDNQQTIENHSHFLLSILRAVCRMSPLFKKLF